MGKYLQLETAPLSDHPVMFGMNMWKSPEQVQQQRMQQLETGASLLAQQVEVSISFLEGTGLVVRGSTENYF
jgi:hypothetical protein